MQTQAMPLQAQSNHAQPKTGATPSANEAPPSNEGWSVRHVVGETVALTVIAAVLYVWGRLFHGAYLEEYGFALSQVQLSLFEILFVTWANVVISVAIIAGLAALWFGRALVLIALWWLLNLIYQFTRFVVRHAIRLTRISGWLQSAGSLFRRGFEWLRSRTPKPLREEFERYDGQGMAAVVAVVYAPILFIVGAVVAANSGKEAARRDMMHAKEITVVCDGVEEPVTGRLVGALGDALILDRPKGDRIERVLFPTGRIRNTSRMIPEGEIVQSKATPSKPNDAVPPRQAPAASPPR